jgi:hypothetical protein
VLSARLTSGMAARRKPAGRRAVRRAAAVGGAAAVLAALTVIGGGTPALADSVRSRQQWVLDAINAPAAWQVSQGATSPSR